MYPHPSSPPSSAPSRPSGVRPFGVRAFLVATALATALALGALGSPARAADAADGGEISRADTLRVIAHADLRTLDPIWTTAYIARNHGYMVYDTLFALDADWHPQPQMVETWSASEDGLRWTFRLREGLLWHDGTPVSAADCVASLRRWQARDSLGQQLGARTESITALSPLEFELVLEQPFGDLLGALAKISSNVPFMMPRQIAETDPFTAIESAVGSGPYIFLREEWVPGVVAVYARNSHYVPRLEAPSNAAGGKVARFERVEWHYVPDPNTALAGLLAGEFDFWEQAPPHLASAVRKRESLELTLSDTLGYQGMLRFNHTQPPFDDPRVRRAAVLALKPLEALAAAVGDAEFQRPCRSLYPCGTPLARDLPPALVRHDPQAARRLLAEAAYDGTPIVLLNPTDIPVLTAFAQVFAEQLRAVGFEVDLTSLDWAALAQRRASREAPADGGWNLFPTAWVSADVLNPAIAAALNTSGESAWFGWPQDEQIERDRTAFLEAEDPEARAEIAHRIQLRAGEIATHAVVGQYLLPSVRRREALTPLIESPVPFFWETGAP